MQDVEIRKLLHSHLRKVNKKIKDTIIINELDLCSGLTRVDVAVVNGVIQGYEIKSDEDTLYRLPNQIKYYNKALEQITITVNPAHLKNIKKIIPVWWGILVVEKNGKHNQIKEYKRSESNPLIEGPAVLELLWKEELISVANKFNIHFNKSASKRIARNIIVQQLEIEQITYEVREALKSRKNWRS